MERYRVNVNEHREIESKQRKTLEKQLFGWQIEKIIHQHRDKSQEECITLQQIKSRRTSN